MEGNFRSRDFFLMGERILLCLMIELSDVEEGKLTLQQREGNH